MDLKHEDEGPLCPLCGHQTAIVTHSHDTPVVLKQALCFGCVNHAAGSLWELNDDGDFVDEKTGIHKATWAPVCCAVPMSAMPHEKPGKRKITGPLSIWFDHWLCGLCNNKLPFMDPI